MMDILWTLLPLIGLGLVVLANAHRARRTGNASCLGHLFVSAQNLTTLELIANRGGIALFVAGVVVNVF